MVARRRCQSGGCGTEHRENSAAGVERHDGRHYSRAIALDTHLPALSFVLSLSVALLSALLAGQVMSKRKHRSALYIILYATIISITIYADAAIWMSRGRD